MMELSLNDCSPGEESEPTIHSEASIDSTDLQSNCDPTMPVTAHLLQEVNFSEPRKSPLDSLYRREDSLEGFLSMPDDLNSGDSIAAPIKMDLFPDFEITYIMPSELSTLGLDMCCGDSSNDGTSNDRLEPAPPLIGAQAQLADLNFQSVPRAVQSRDLCILDFNEDISLPKEEMNISLIGTSKKSDSAKHDKAHFTLTNSPAKSNNSVDNPAINVAYSNSETINELICDVCNKTFAHKSSLVYHLRSHSGQRPYQCDICCKTFTRPGFLTVHKKTHSGPNYSCKICSKSFIQLYSLRLHEKMHTGDRPYKCDQCDQCFARPNILQKHKKTHLAVKPFNCEVCQKRFGRPDHLLIHKRTHLKETSFCCGICGKYFVSADGLQRHEQNHTEQKTHVCETCGKSFSRASYLSDHRKRHTAEKKFKCQDCNKQFSSTSLLAQHQVIHSSERPFPCHLCEKKFRRKTHLKQHLKVHYKS